MIRIIEITLKNIQIDFNDLLYSGLLTVRTDDKRALQIAIRSQERRSSVKNGVQQIRAEARLTLPGSAPGHEVQTAGVGTTSSVLDVRVITRFKKILPVKTVHRFKLPKTDR